MVNVLKTLNRLFKVFPHTRMKSLDINKTCNCKFLYKLHEGCQSGAGRLVCAIKGSSPILTFLTNHRLIHNGNDVDFLRRTHFRKGRGYNIHLDMQIFNVTPDKQGKYDCRISYNANAVVLKVASK